MGGNIGIRRAIALCAALLIALVVAPPAAAVTWKLQNVPAPQHPNAQGLSISCASATSCMAAGFYINQRGQQSPVTEVWNGSSWTIEAVPLPFGTSFGVLRGVSCTSATACTAVGGAGGSEVPDQPLAVRWNGA